MVGFSSPTVVLVDKDFSGQANTGDGISDCQVLNLYQCFPIVCQKPGNFDFATWVEIQSNKEKSA